MPNSALARVIGFKKTHDLVAKPHTLWRIMRWGERMKEATKRAASEALAQTLAVTAMLVIAGVLFYSR